MLEIILYYLLCLGHLTESRATCPSQCYCKKHNINCSYKSLISLSGIESAVNEADNLDISHNHLSWISVVSAKKIDASSNLVQLFPDLASTVQSLNLKDNKLRYVNSEMCPESLKYLDLSENPIQEVNLQCHGLEVLNISHADIEIIPDKFLSMFPSLRVLHLDVNPLMRINGDLSSETLEVLTIQRTQLRYIKKSTFSGLTKLKVLNLNGNKHIHMLNIQSPVNVLLAQQCSLETVELTGMTELTRLDVSDNHVSSLQLPDSVLDLNASNNLLNFIELRNVKRADLSKNKLISLDLKPMEWLDVSANQQIRFLRLASIKYLDASQCGISVIEPANSRFQTLNLSRNAIETFPKGVSVQKLDLSYNRLSSFRIKIEGLEEVRLIGNRFVLAEDVIGQGKMYLSNNPWTCDCRMDHLFRVADDVELLRCDHPRNASGLTWTEACYKSKIPRWMLNHPYIPFVISLGLLILAMLFFYWLKKKLDSSPLEEPPQAEPVTEVILPPTVINNDLPSYEEALLMPPIAKKVNVVTQTRSYEVLSRRLSSNSI